jgi:hypothetical protein
MAVATEEETDPGGFPDLHPVRTRATALAAVTERSWPGGPGRYPAPGHDHPSDTHLP